MFWLQLVRIAFMGTSTPGHLRLSPNTDRIFCRLGSVLRYPLAWIRGSRSLVRWGPRSALLRVGGSRCRHCRSDPHLIADDVRLFIAASPQNH